MEFHFVGGVPEGDKEYIVSDIHECDPFLQRVGHRRFERLETAFVTQTGILRLVNEMRKKILYLFHVVIIASMALTMGGCGHKKPPYYPKERKAVQNP